MTVDTSMVARRKLRFGSIEDLLVELENIERAHVSGSLMVQGNWSVGQILSHIAAWIDYGWDGYPLKPPPFFIRWILKFMVKKYLRDGMPAGVKIPGIKAGTVGQDDVPFEQALERLRKSLQRLSSGEQAKFHSPAFGQMSHENRIALNLRHSELHLSFLSY